MEPEIKILLIGMIVFGALGSIFVYEAFVWKPQYDAEQSRRESACVSAGFDHYFVAIAGNGIRNVQGKDYIACEREQVIDGQYNRTERWVPYTGK